MLIASGNSCENHTKLNNPIHFSGWHHRAVLASKFELTDTITVTTVMDADVFI